ncbi:MAG TPA: phage portal protein, partial [Anaerolineaceae bacterium]|nr:phage portal protein [Anaerolineaceae bacterium]
FSQAGKVWPESDMVYIKEFSYSDDLTSGISTVQACLNDAGLMNYQTRFASRFFEAGAMPIVLVSADGLIEEEKQRIQNFFSKLASGVGNAWRALATRTKLTPEVVSQDLDKMTMPELYAQATKNIANAFGIPVNMFSGDDNYASADSHRMQFWQDTVRPRGRIVEEALNRQVLKPMGLRMEFAFDEMDIFQEDETQRAQAFSLYVEAGVNPMVAKEMLGIESNTDIPFMAPQPEPIETEKPLDVTVDVTAEFEKWERKALKRIKDGKSADCQFDSELIPLAIQDEIHAALKLCVEPDEVKRVFGGEYESPQDIGLYKELKRANELLERSLMDKPEFHITVNTKDVDEPITEPA